MRIEFGKVPPQTANSLLKWVSEMLGEHLSKCPIELNGIQIVIPKGDW